MHKIYEVAHWKFFFIDPFLDASSHLYKRVCPSVGRSVGRSVCLSRFCKKCMKLRVLCTEIIKKVYKVMNNIKTAL